MDTGDFRLSKRGIFLTSLHGCICGVSEITCIYCCGHSPGCPACVLDISVFCEAFCAGTKRLRKFINGVSTPTNKALRRIV